MRKNYQLEDGHLSEAKAETPDFIVLKAPSKSEIGQLQQTFDFPFDYLESILDDYENARFELDKNGNLLLLLEFPALNDIDEVETFPYALILTRLGTVILAHQHECDMKTIFTEKFEVKSLKYQLIFRVVREMTQAFNNYLTDFRGTRYEVARSIKKSTKNDQLLALINIQSSLVYFQDALTNNLEVLTEMRNFLSSNGQNGFAESIDRLKVETDQAQTDSRIQEKLLENLRDLFSNIVANNLNIVMKIMTSATFVLGIPAVIVGFYGMNLPIPGQEIKWMVWAVLIAIVLLCALVSWWLKKKDMM